MFILKFIYVFINVGENLMKFVEFCFFGIYEVVVLLRFVKFLNLINIEMLMSCVLKRVL